MKKSSSALVFVLTALSFGCTTPKKELTGARSESALPADRLPAQAPPTISGLEQIDYVFKSHANVPEGFRLPDYLAGRKHQFARNDDGAQYYSVSRANSMNPRFNDMLFRVFSNGRDSAYCTVGSVVKDFKVVTNRASDFGAIFIQGDVMYGVLKSKRVADPYSYSNRCKSGPSETEMISLFIDKDSGGKYKFWTYFPGEGEDAARSLAFFMIASNPAPNLTLVSGDGQSSSTGVGGEIQLNPCFRKRGKPYSSFVALYRYRNDRKIMWIDPADPHGSVRNETTKNYDSILQFMREQNISSDGKTCL